MTGEKGKDHNEGSKLILSPAPHIHSEKSTRKIMFIVCFALLFPTAGGVYYFGIYTLFVLSVSVITAVLTEYIAKFLRKREFIMDGSAIVTGMLLALVMPPRVPLWIVVIGAAFAIAIVKEAFGGLGYNIFNPALAGRAFLAVTFAGFMTRWIAPVSSPTGIDSTTTATPLSDGFVNSGSTHDLYMDLLLGDVGGCIGETSALLVLIGGLILLATGVIKWRVPGIFIGTVFLLTWIIPGEDPIFHILAGGLFLGAFFMATDYVTIPLTDKGQFIFAAGAGVLVVMIRLWGSMAEGVAFSILLMNAVTPLIDRYVRPKPYGYIPPEKPLEDNVVDTKKEVVSTSKKDSGRKEEIAGNEPGIKEDTPSGAKDEKSESGKDVRTDTITDEEVAKEDSEELGEMVTESVPEENDPTDQNEKMTGRGENGE